ncbi:hypothetical protein C7212DRAFT_362818 [Tuber magnatum]|uniref:Granulins domain-containing protein n=1 Tax=Tuber magnatum TaxID=42249 RepID=A0A317SUQ9_9PEZI|nr:hypothetical protein C7212DRAFT_362818 [Tuber magnatum]
MKFFSVLLVTAFASAVASTHTHQTPKNHLQQQRPSFYRPRRTARRHPRPLYDPERSARTSIRLLPEKDLGFCGKENSCCPMKGACCPMGAGCCAGAGSGCFPDKDGKTRCCNMDMEKLCSSKTCIPKNAVCCRDGNYCAAGSYCVKGGCCPTGNICKGKTGGKASGYDPRGVAPARLREV